jgi:V-type H+-transporting ATPase subunit a
MYNDFLSLGLDLFGTRYKEGPSHGHDVEWVPKFDVTNSGGPGPYPFGLDPAWHGATNQLLFVNSMKMKLAVLLGVLQMVAGTFLSFANAVYEKSSINFFLQCLPQLIFMLLFFGYMDFLIIYKWTHVGNAPSIINTMICMGLGPDLPADPELCPGPATFQSLHRMLIMVCVPWMLIPKPAALYWQHKQQQAHGYAALGQHDDETASYTGSYSKKGSKEKEHEDFDFAEICIHQVIETIEFVLGSISHTASYLRLWALSLAHQQLSLVFFQKFMLTAFAAGGALAAVQIFFATACFIGVSVCFLMGVDVLECFLHTLRLHWVEFQSKFFKGDGHSFEPYSHQRVIAPSAGQ